MIASIDLGFGCPKATDGKKTWRQPAVLGEPRPLFDNTLKPDDVQYIGDKHYFVGNLAVRQSQLRYFSTAENKPEGWMSEIFLKTALGIVAPHETVSLVTGLPLDFYFHQKSGFENLLNNFNSSRPYKIIVGHDETTCLPRISRYKIIPQGLGAAMDYLLDNTGKIVHPEAAGGRVLVLDVGYYTLGKLILDSMEISPASSSPNLGINEAYKLIQTNLREQGHTVDRNDLDRAILNGKYTELRNKAFRTLAKQYDMEIANLNNVFDLYIICGGWAPQIADYLTLPRNKTIVLDGLANVRGYQKVGVRLWGVSACEKIRTAI